MLPRFRAPRGLSSLNSDWPVVVLMSGWARGVGLWELRYFLFHNGAPVPRIVVSTHSPRVAGYVDGNIRLRLGIWAANRS